MRGLTDDEKRQDWVYAERQLRRQLATAVNVESRVGLMLNLATGFARAGQPDAAFALFEEAERLAPEPSRIFAETAFFLSDQRRFDASLFTRIDGALAGVRGGGSRSFGNLVDSESRIFAKLRGCMPPRPPRPPRGIGRLACSISDRSATESATESATDQ